VRVVNFMSEQQTQKTQGESHPAVEKIAKIAKQIDAVRHELCRYTEQISNITCAEVKVPKSVLYSDQVDAVEFWWELKKDKWLEKFQRAAAYESAVGKLSYEERRLLGL
jgi:hypothetical protein